MQNKLKNLFIREPRLAKRLIIIAVLIGATMLLARAQKAQTSRLEKIKQKTGLVAQIPELKEQIRAISKGEVLTEAESRTTQIKDLALKGVFMQNKLYYCLIGDTFYKKGDACGNFDILDITINSVVLQEKNTKNTKRLFLPE